MRIIMNWTEGSLARHSRGRQRNAVIARQKQHFAKARSNLLSGRTNQCPVTISFLPPESTPNLSYRSALSQKHHDRLSSPLLSIKREPKRERPAYLRDDDNIAASTNIDKRKRLLEKSDWAGLGLQKPLDISFPGQIYATRRWIRAARFPERVPNQLREYGAVHGEGRLGHRKRPSMRIQVGSQEIQPSIATGSQSSVKRDTTEPERSAHISRHNLTSRSSHCMRSTPGCEGYGYANIAISDISRALPTSLHGPETPVNVVYSSSVIHEPTPHRDINLPVLQWSPPSSEAQGSMEVEIERPARPVPSSQESEQQRWKDWVLCGRSSNLPSNSPLTTMDTSDVHTRDSASSATLPSHLQLRLPSLHLSDAAHEPPGWSLSEHSSNEGVVGSCDPSLDNQRPLTNHKSQTSNQRCTPQEKPDVPDDLNDIWMKFAYGDDENSEELLMDGLKEAAHQAAVELRPSDTSGSEDEHVETAATCGTESSIEYQHMNCAISPRSSADSHIATLGTTDSETAPSNMATVGSSGKPPRNTMRFIMPKAFVGKHVHGDQDAIARAFTANGPTSSKKKKGKRRKKMAMDGRTDIRSLPDFDGDPIEEIEDD
ncbi:hypothetical protein HD806DRAFT_426159 [Xylariaceae sp. AK1471]|nr:hypothetical protein HD806DRAFT_426159 [Xylariaceae sp. AK1471]